VVLRLGLRNLRRWIALLGTVNASSPVAARIILTRAQTCFELASRSRGKAIDPDQAFLVGLLSGVDVLLGIRKSAFLEKLQMPEAVQHALNSHEGALGRNLKVVLNLEQAVQMKQDLDRVDNRLLRLYQQAGTTVQQLLSGA
jgi:EAL and modified HD-GYP domain-containing signal transduction protein